MNENSSPNSSGLARWFDTAASRRRSLRILIWTTATLLLVWLFFVDLSGIVHPSRWLTLTLLVGHFLAGVSLALDMVQNLRDSRQKMRDLGEVFLSLSPTVFLVALLYHGHLVDQSREYAGPLLRPLRTTSRVVARSPHPVGLYASVSGRPGGFVFA